MPLEAARSAQTDLTFEALRPLYETFAGFELSREAVEQVAKELFSRTI